jgi:hypothetical protein
VLLRFPDPRLVRQQKIPQQGIEQTRLFQVNRMGATRHNGQSYITDFPPQAFHLFPLVGSIEIT